MILFKKIPFTFEEKDYEIRVYYNYAIINVVIFQNNYPANGFRHQIKISKKLSVKEFLEQNDYEVSFSTHMVNDLIIARKRS